MPTINIIRLTNITLRGITLASKFILIFFLAKFLPLEELGLYGLITAAISYSLYLVGFDFHTYTTREIIFRKKGNWGFVLKNHMAVTALLYIIFTPLISIIFLSDILPKHFAAWFFILLLLEHLAQELNRILAALSEISIAGTALFLRSGAWIFPAVLVMSYDSNFHTLETVLLFWAIGGGIACILSIWRIKKLTSNIWSSSIDIAWIRKGLHIAFPFLISTLAMRGIFTLDRYWMEYLTNLEIVGVYVLFISLSSALISLLDAGVFVFFYPLLVSAYSTKNLALFRQSMKKLVRHSLFISVIFIIAAITLINPILQLLENSLYLENQWIFPLVMLATFLHCMGMLPQFGLYAQGKDWHIIISHILALMVFVISTWAISKIEHMLSIPLSICIALLFSFGWKTYAYQSTETNSKHHRDNL